MLHHLDHTIKSEGQGCINALQESDQGSGHWLVSYISEVAGQPKYICDLDALLGEIANCLPLLKKLDGIKHGISSFESKASLALKYMGLVTMPNLHIPYLQHQLKECMHAQDLLASDINKDELKVLVNMFHAVDLLAIGKAEKCLDVFTKQVNEMTDLSVSSTQSYMSQLKILMETFPSFDVSNSESDLRSYIIGVFKLLQTVDRDFLNRFFGQSLDVLIENGDAIFKQIKDVLNADKPGTTALAIPGIQMSDLSDLFHKLRPLLEVLSKQVSTNTAISQEDEDHIVSLVREHSPHFTRIFKQLQPYFENFFVQISSKGRHYHPKELTQYDTKPDGSFDINTILEGLCGKFFALMMKSGDFFMTDAERFLSRLKRQDRCNDLQTIITQVQNSEVQKYNKKISVRDLKVLVDQCITILQKTSNYGILNALENFIKQEHDQTYTEK